MSNYLQRVFASATGAAPNIRAAAAPPASLPFAAHADDTRDSIAFTDPAPAQRSHPLAQLSAPARPGPSGIRDQALPSIRSAQPTKVATRSSPAATTSDEANFTKTQTAAAATPSAISARANRPSASASASPPTSNSSSRHSISAASSRQQPASQSARNLESAG